MDQPVSSVDSVNWFYRMSANTNNMLFFTMNYFDTENYNHIKTAATLLMTVFSSHLDLHDGRHERLAFTGKKDNGNEQNPLRSLFCLSLLYYLE